MTRMPFGMYQGKLLSEMPLDYLRWLRRQYLREPLFSALVEELRRRECHHTSKKPPQEVPMPMVKRLIQCGFRQLAHELHPDKGGDHHAMQELNQARDWLKQKVETLA